jgi:hypothetical protein
MNADSGAHGSFTFRIYPGGAAGGADGVVIGPPDDAERIVRAPDRIQGTGTRFHVRGYLPVQDVAEARSTGVRETPLRLAQCRGSGRLLDLVLQFQSEHGDVAGCSSSSDAPYVPMLRIRASCRSARSRTYARRRRTVHRRVSARPWSPVS